VPLCEDIWGDTEVLLHAFLIYIWDLGEWLASRLGCFAVGERTLVPVGWRLCGPQSGSGREKIFAVWSNEIHVSYKSHPWYYKSDLDYIWYCIYTKIVGEFNLCSYLSIIAPNVAPTAFVFMSTGYVSELRSPTVLLFTPRCYDYGAMVDWYWQGKDRKTRRKTFPSVSPAQIPYALTMEAVRTYETSVFHNETTWRNIPEGSYLHV
jgi:hypothetical protein